MNKDLAVSLVKIENVRTKKR